MRKFDVAMLLAILCVAAGLRLWAPWDDVFPPAPPGAGGARVNFLETDAWYHVRLAENQVRNFPHRVTVDPYASPGGQYVAVAPLLDTITATAAVVTQGRNASTAYIERVAALVPAVVGVLAVGAVWALATFAFDRRAGLIAGLLAAVLPGHFLDRTLVGFVDHHALEVLLAFATLAGLVFCISRPASAPGATAGRQAPRQEMPPRQEVPSRQEVPIPAVLTGLCLGLYLLSWASGSYLVAILAAWIVLAAIVAPAVEAQSAARSTAIAAGVALLLVLVFQDPALFRYNSQIASLVALPIASVAVMLFAARIALALSVLAAAAIVSGAAAWFLMPGLVQQVTIDLGRFRPDPTRMAVLEARPLFLYTGNWLWEQPWTFFRSGFYIGLIAVAGLLISLWKTRRADHLLIVCFTVANYLATLGQNRFGYYLVPATAVVCAWLAVRILDWGGVPHADNPQPKLRRAFPMQREAAVVLVAGLIVAPNLVPAAITTTRVGGMPIYWFQAMEWLRTQTPEPFASPEYYYARYGPTNPPAAYSVMNWWDQGYWIVQTARRVPVSNPTQGGAPRSAAFLTATDEAAALAIMAGERSRYAMVDWELPFRDAGGGALGGRFQNLADWAGIPTSRFYSLCFSRAGDGDPWQATWVFREPYYQSMAYRLMVLGGVAAAPVNNTYVVEIRQRTDATGRAFCEVANRAVFTTAAEARQSAAQGGPAFEAVGLTPWQPAFDVAAIQGLRPVAEFRDPAQQANETPMVRVFEVATPPVTP